MSAVKVFSAKPSREVSSYSNAATKTERIIELRKALGLNLREEARLAELRKGFRKMNNPFLNPTL